MDDTFGLLVDLLKRHRDVIAVQTEVISAIACLADVGRFLLLVSVIEISEVRISLANKIIKKYTFSFLHHHQSKRFN